MRIPLRFYVFFSALYALQGVTVAYITNFNKRYMHAAGVSTNLAALVESIALGPMIFKFLIAPFSDKFNLFGKGHRLPYITIGLLAQALGLAGLATVNPGKRLALYAALAFLAVAGLAIYDTCCDGMVIDLADADDRPKIQSALWTSRFAATTLSTLGFGYLLHHTGAGPGKGEIVLWLCVAATCAPLAVSLRLKEPPRLSALEEFEWRALGALVKPRTLAILAFGGAYGMVGIGTEFNLSPFYASLGFGDDRIGEFGALRYAGRALGALALPFAWKRLGRSGVLTLGVVSLALSAGLFAADGGAWRMRALGLFFGAANGWNDALFAILAMECSDPRMAASTFALVNAVTNLSVLGNAIFARCVAAAGGRYSVVFVGASVVSIALLALVPPLARRPVRASSDGGGAP